MILPHTIWRFALQVCIPDFNLQTRYLDMLFAPLARPHLLHRQIGELTLITEDAFFSHCKPEVVQTKSLDRYKESVFVITNVSRITTGAQKASHAAPPITANAVTATIFAANLQPSTASSTALLPPLL